MKFLKNLIASIIMLPAFLLAVPASAEALAGSDYTVINPAQPTNTGNKIEVLEFFFYGCSHCFHLHPELAAWEKKMPKDVELVLVPTVFNPQWEPMAYTYYALEALGQLNKLHNDLYDAWNVKQRILTDEAGITDFISKFGVDKKSFSDAYHSFGVQSKITRSKQLTQTYRISGTPTVIVDGKYLINGLQPGDTIRVLRELIEKARKERTGKR